MQFRTDASIRCEYASRQRNTLQLNIPDHPHPHLARKCPGWGKTNRPATSAWSIKSLSQLPVPDLSDIAVHATKAKQCPKWHRFATACKCILSTSEKGNSRPNKYPPSPVQRVVPALGSVVCCTQVLRAQNHTWSGNLPLLRPPRGNEFTLASDATSLQARP